MNVQKDRAERDVHRVYFAWLGFCWEVTGIEMKEKAERDVL